MPAIANPTRTAINNIGVTAQQVITSNPGRSKLKFHNPGTNDIIIFPQLVFINGVSTTLAVGGTLALGGGTRVYANGGDQLIDDLSVFFAWLAQAVSGSNNPLTITEYR